MKGYMQGRMKLGIACLLVLALDVRGWCEGEHVGPPAATTGPLDSVAETDPDTLQGLLHLGSDWSISTQATYIEQFHFSFPSAYEGPNSFTGNDEEEHTFSYSLFLGRRLWNGTELFLDPEIFQGHGLSRTFGIAGYPNGEAVKSGFANLHFNTSRLFIRHEFDFGGGKEKLEADPRQFAEEEDVDRLVISVGKFSANDFFDDNAFSHDPRVQFMNWALWESAAWDYPADIVGFTSGAVAEWNTQNSTLHYGIFMEPTEANGARLDYHLWNAHGQILQYDYRYTWGGRHGTVRSFAYWNQADMGSYAVAAGQPDPEDIISTRSYRSKVGFGSSWDQELGGGVGAFARLSWNDGRTESFTFTEIDRSIAGGLSLDGAIWRRPSESAGIALAINGLSSDHRHYLESGGTGLILGDGSLSYSPEEIVEAYYMMRPWHFLQIGPDVQYIRNPGYNAARGPVPVYAIRGHVEF
jgi:high affinity Mn2+ porin